MGEYDREMGAINSRMDTMEKSLTKTDEKIDKIEISINEKLKDIKNGIVELNNKERFTQGFIKALVIIVGIVGFGITTYIKMH